MPSEWIIDLRDILQSLPQSARYSSFVVLDFGFGLYTVVRSYLTPESSTATVQAQGWDMGVWLAMAAAADILLAMSLAFEMRKRRTGHFKTDSVLNRLALYGVATGAVTAILVIILLFLFVVADIVEILLLFALPLGGVYIVTLLSNLHLRSSLRSALGTSRDFELRHRRNPTSLSQYPKAQTTIVIIRSEHRTYL
ncbi:hypothetical protein DL93DRAFT_2164517 [Clavulina sp. PMI_390]|nr:hypothetical protein DL93DRAFT_2164517 [Clavulina sp. PMI_390]